MTPDRIQFKYSANRTVVHTVECGMYDAVLVVGDPENAAYEWVVMKGGVVDAHSDSAYGSPEIALRDGLIHLLGMPRGCDGSA